jgi:dihydroneopterin aldolase
LDRISLHNVVAYGRHGANPGERDRRQPFEIDLDLDVDLHRAQKSDRLADTIDYARIHREMARVVENESFELLERLAGALLDVVFEDERVVRAELRVGKPRLLDGATPSITLLRENPKYREFR